MEKHVVEAFAASLAREIALCKSGMKPEEYNYVAGVLNGLTSLNPTALVSTEFATSYTQSCEDNQELSDVLCRILINFKAVISEEAFSQLITDIARATHISGDHNYSSVPPSWKLNDPHTVIGESVRFRAESHIRVSPSRKLWRFLTRGEPPLTSEEVYVQWLKNNQHMVVLFMIQLTHTPIGEITKEPQ